MDTSEKDINESSIKKIVEDTVEVNCDKTTDEDSTLDDKAGSSSHRRSSSDQPEPIQDDPLRVLTPEFVDVKFNDEPEPSSVDNDALENGLNEREDEEEKESLRWPLFSHNLHEDYPDFDPSVQILKSPNEFQPSDLLSLLR